LASQRCHVRFDRGLGDAEVEGDLLVRQSEMDPAQYAQLSRGKSLDTGRDRTGARQPGRGRQPVRKRLVRLVFVHLSPPQTWWLQAAFGVGHCLDWRRAGYDVPLLVNLQPAGDYLGERFHRAGGVPAVMAELLRAGRLHGARITVTGATVADNLAGVEASDRDVIRPYENPIMANAG